MPEPLPDERLAEIRTELARQPKYALEHDAMDIGRELLAEVDRLKAHLQVSFGASEALCENANQLDADCRRLRNTAAEMLAAFRFDVHPGYKAKQSYMVPVETLDKWREAIWPTPAGWSVPSLPEIEQGSLWDCPNSALRGQRAHNFGDLEQPPRECLNGCGMTWARLQEATA